MPWRRPSITIAPPARSPSPSTWPLRTGGAVKQHYRDLREFLHALEAHDMLVRYTAPIDKDTQLQPLVRLQFRGLPEAQRKGFLFEQVTAASGRRYDMPVAACCMAASRAMYALGLGCAPREIGARWAHALANPVPPELVAHGP